jgi:hypothetical protein
VGYSDVSTELSILTATVPGKPSTPSTSISGTNVVISWTVPDDGSAAIVGYVITILQEDGVTFTEDLTYCDGSDSTILSSQSCTVPIATLRANPYNLEWGSSVYVKVTGINV